MDEAKHSNRSRISIDIFCKKRYNHINGELWVFGCIMCMHYIVLLVCIEIMMMEGISYEEYFICSIRMCPFY